MSEERHTPGPWDTEPSSLDFEAHGLACHIKRHKRYGHLIGYVGVSGAHPFYGMGADATRLMAHGDRITFGGEGFWPEADPSLWYFGFHCYHEGDLAPFSSFDDGPHATYRDLSYVRGETESLAGQLAAIAEAEGREVAL